MRLLFVIVFGTLAVCQAGVIEEFSPRIINGREAEPGEFPWIVALTVGNSTEKSATICGGSLINHHWVLTAAHCVAVKDEVPSFAVLSVKAGKQNQYKEEDSEQVSLWGVSFMHEKFDNTGIPGPYDIGIIKLQTPFTYTKRVQPIPLPPPLYETKPGSMATVAGWGKISNEHLDYPAILHTVQLPIIDRKTCQNLSDTPVDETNLCAATINGRAFCSGDSGGPLVTKIEGETTLIGCVSFGPAECGKPHTANVFTRVSYFIDWIDEKILEN